MDDDDFARAVAVRVGVLFRGPPVRRPARVADSISAVERLQSNGLFKVAQLAFGTANRQRALFINDGNARRVIAAIFQFAKPVENHPNDLLVTNVADDSAHLTSLFWMRKNG